MHIEMALTPLEDMGEHRIQDSESTNYSPLQDMHAAHSRFSNVSNKVDALIETAHRLRLSNQLSDTEMTSFTSAMVDMTECLEEWHNFFKVVVPERSNQVPNLDDLIFLGATSPCNLVDNCNSSSISTSPLVPSSAEIALFPLTPLDKSQVVPKRNLAAISAVRSALETRMDTEASEVTPSLLSSSPLKCSAASFSECDIAAAVRRPLPETPTRSVSQENSSTAANAEVIPPLETPIPVPLGGCLSTNRAVIPPPEIPSTPSPPCPLQVEALTLDRKGSSLATPAHFPHAVPKSPKSMELITPLPPPELVKKYPRWFGKTGSLRSPSTPFLGKTPSRICRPLQLQGNGSSLNTVPPSEPKFVTPCATSRKYPETPFLTPGSVLPPITPMSGSKGFTPLVDDITASAIKRMGVKGLEEELWRKLKAWNIDSCLTGRPSRKSRLSFGGNKNNDLESIKENVDQQLTASNVDISGQGEDCHLEEGFEVRRREFLI